MRYFLHEVRISWRRLWRRPGFTLLVAGIIGLGIGANAIAFSFLYGIVLRPLPFADPHRLVSLWSTRPTGGVDREDVSYPDFLDWRSRSRSVDMAAFGSWRLTLSTADGPERVSTLVISPNLFDLLGVRPRYGRVFRPDEATPGRDRVVMLSDGLWRRRFAADPKVVGTSVRFNDEPYEVVGILPADFRFPTTAVELWKPMAFTPQQMPRESRWLQVVGRLRADISLEQARRELTTIAAGIEREDPEHATGWRVDVAPLHTVIVGRLGAALIVLQVLLGLVVFVTCANVANLVLARSRSQERDTAIRLALGASRLRVLGSMLSENLLLSALGVVIGVLLSVGGVRASLALLPPGADETNFADVAGHSFPRLSEVTVDGWVLGFSVLLCLVMSGVFTAVAFLQSRSRALQGVLTASGRTIGRSGTRRLVRGLVAAEIAGALVLLIGAGVLSRSFLQLVRVDPGFRSERVQTMELSLRQYRDGLQRAAFIQRLMEEVRGVPGVEAAGFSTAPPFTGNSTDVEFRLQGEPGATTATEQPRAIFHAVDAGYFAALKIPLRRGRFHDDHDTAMRPRVVMANEALVRRYGGAQDLLGKRIVAGEERVPYEIVGIVGDTLQSGLDGEAAPELFFAYQQAPPWFMRLVVRTAGPPEASLSSIKRRIWTIDPGMTFRSVSTLDSLIDNSLVQRRLQVTLIDFASGLALVLAILGIYAMIVHAVTERRHEIGVRLAMGALRSRVVWMLVGEAALLAAVGVAVGLALAVPFTGLLSRFLFGVSPMDPASVASASLLVLIVALVASYLPARRVSQIDPVSILKHE